MFADATTLAFATEAEDELRRRGYSKDGKPHRAQVVLALLQTEDGLPLGYRVFPGNTADVRTLEPLVAELRVQYQLGRVVVVADAGMASSENIAALDAAGFDRVLAASLRKLPVDEMKRLSESSEWEPHENPDRLFGLVSAFNPETVESFALSAGGFGTRYGDRLFSLRTVKNRPGSDRFAGTTSLGIADDNLVFEGPLPGPGTFVLTGRRTCCDLVVGRFIDQNLPSFLDTQLHVAWDFAGGHRLTLIGLRSREDTDFSFEDEEEQRFALAGDTASDLGAVRLEAVLSPRATSRTVLAAHDNAEQFAAGAVFRDADRGSGLDDESDGRSPRSPSTASWRSATCPSARRSPPGGGSPRWPRSARAPPPPVRDRPDDRGRAQRERGEPDQRPGRCRTPRLGTERDTRRRLDPGRLAGAPALRPRTRAPARMEHRERSRRAAAPPQPAGTSGTASASRRRPGSTPRVPATRS